MSKPVPALPLVMGVTLFSALGSTAVPVKQQIIETGGYSQSGIGNARYRRLSAAPSSPNALYQAQSLDGAWWELAEGQVDPTMFGAKADGFVFNDATIGGGNLFQVTHSHQGHIFTSADVGKSYVLRNGLGTGSDLITTIASVASAYVINLTAAASGAITDGSGLCGSDDAAAINAALSLLGVANAYTWNVAQPYWGVSGANPQWWHGAREVVLRAPLGRLNAMYCVSSPVRLQSGVGFRVEYGARLAALPNFAGEAVVHQLVGWTLASFGGVNGGASTGYAVNDVLVDVNNNTSATTGGGGAQFVVASVDGGGKPLTLTQKYPGAYSANPAGTMTLTKLTSAAGTGNTTISATTTQTAAALEIDNVALGDLTVDAGGFADKCLWIQRGADITLNGAIFLYNGLNRGAKFGNDKAAQTDQYDRLITMTGSGKLHIEGLSWPSATFGSNVARGANNAAYINTNGVGFEWAGLATDNSFAGPVQIIGYSTGYKEALGAGNNRMNTVHCWTSQYMTPMAVGFDLQGAESSIQVAFIDSIGNQGSACYGVKVGAYCSGAITHLGSTVNAGVGWLQDNTCTLIYNNNTAGSPYGTLDIFSVDVVGLSSAKYAAVYAVAGGANDALVNISNINGDGNWHTHGFNRALNNMGVNAVVSETTARTAAVAGLTASLAAVATNVPGSPWTPAQLSTATLAAWFDCQTQPPSVDGSSKVTGWASRSNALTAATHNGFTTSTAPTFGATAFDGTRPGITFNGTGSGDCLFIGTTGNATPLIGDLFPGGSTNFVVLAAIKRTTQDVADTGSRRTVFAMNSNNGASVSVLAMAQFYNQSQDAGQAKVRFGLSGGGAADAVAAMAANTTAILEYCYTQSLIPDFATGVGVTGGLIANNAIVKSGAGQTGGLATQTQVSSIGGTSSSTADRAGMVIGELIILNSPTQDQINRCRGYLAKQWYGAGTAVLVPTDPYYGTGPITQAALTTAVVSVFTGTADKTVANTVTQTSLVPSGSGSMSIPANTLVVGKMYRLTARGVYSTTGSPTLAFAVKLGSVTLVSGTISTLESGASAVDWAVDAIITCRTTGASGSVQIDGRATFETAAGTLGKASLNNGGAAVTVDTTATALLDLLATWGAASASNTLTAKTLALEALN